MRKWCSIFIAMFFLLWPLAVFAHSGGTDSMGGHYDNSTGEYHFHHGKSAHQHTNGRCPYDKTGRTDWPTAKPSRATQTPKPYTYSSSKSYTASKKYTPATVRPTSIPKQESDGTDDSALQSVGIACAGAAAGGVGVSLFRRRNKG